MAMVRWVVLRAPTDPTSPNFARLTPDIAQEATISLEIIPESAIADLENDPLTIAAAPEMPTSLIEPFSGTSSPPSKAWGLTATGADVSQYDGSGVKVAVLDTGIDAAHPAFAGVSLKEMDFTGSGNGDLKGHGTHCSGTIFGRDVGCRIGVARGVSDVFIGKVLDDSGHGTALMVFDALQWAVSQGANIVSLSLGFDTEGLIAHYRRGGWPDELAAAIGLDAYRKNVRLFDRQMDVLRAQRGLGRETLVIAATGNASRRSQRADFRIPACLPAAAEGVISVGALGRTANGLEVAEFSNTLPTLSAPGVDILSASPGGSLVSLTGTSMACPHVTGVAALWWQSLGKAASADAVAAKLIATASASGLVPGFDRTDVGAGLVVAP